MPRAFVRTDRPTRAATCAVCHTPSPGTLALVARRTPPPHSAWLAPSRHARSLLPPVAHIDCSAKPRLLVVLMTMVLLHHRLPLNAWNQLVPAFPMLQNACFKCFGCFRSVFQMDVAIVERTLISPRGGVNTPV